MKMLRPLSVLFLLSLAFGCKAPLQTQAEPPKLTIEQLTALVKIDPANTTSKSAITLDAPLTIKNVSPILNAIADEQGIEPGSAEWSAAGIAVYSGQTGGQGSYGWNHACRLNKDFVRAVIANYAHRCVYYLNAPTRSGTYLSGGRPIPYSPEFPGDLPGGEHVYKTSKGDVKVSGPDVQHFQMGPLFAVADSKGYTVKAQGKDYPAEQIAGLIVRMLMTTSAGQVRGGKGFLWGDRGTSMILLNAARAAKRGLIEKPDQEAIFNWAKDSCLPFYLKAPGHQINTKDNGLPTPNFQTYNGIFWLMPAFYEASQVATPEMKVQFEQALKVWSQWTVDLDQIVPEYGLDIFAFSATDEILKGTNNLPVPSLVGKLTKLQIGGGPEGSDWSEWNFRAAMIAQVYAGAKADPLVTKLKAKWLPQIKGTDAKSLGHKVWIVKADGSYFE